MELHLEGKVCSQSRTWLVANFCEGQTDLTNGGEDMVPPLLSTGEVTSAWCGYRNGGTGEMGVSEPRKRLTR